ncbi:MAG: hypothetical protein HC927_09430 [Deltaproteobacteria bacterium]|nr:hypothetical protein [Deltaproteobacteria bacterium]
MQALLPGLAQVLPVEDAGDYERDRKADHEDLAEPTTLLPAAEATEVMIAARWIGEQFVVADAGPGALGRLGLAGASSSDSSG